MSSSGSSSRWFFWVAVVIIVAGLLNAADDEEEPFPQPTNDRAPLTDFQEDYQYDQHVDDCIDGFQC